ncbi:hypothetical protein Val02_29580 [Virgisporangium aliadipatigenens]|uniref:Uncharacterized protein n=1 Tax=Virgisporangium aliadipatigenens TaxID=741659 RepID=A0A8J3YKP0_9ACTN|nr:hypothetical protein [Virgisporangium aliadipatigenens]GIJ46072.1 hypothetical protein Val02_29580 [Virgisporangium aliadipatigenens]
MELRIEIAASRHPYDDLCSLIDWLDHEPELRGRVKTLQRSPRDGELGGVVEAVQVAAGAGGALAVLASALRVWLSQPRRSDVRIKVRGRHGRSIEVDARRVADPEALLRTVLTAEEDDGGSS